MKAFRSFSPVQATFVLAFVLLLLVVVLELWGSGYHQILAKLTLTSIMLAVSLTLTNGFTGLFSLGHPAFMTLGAYVAIAFTYPASRKSFAMSSLPRFFEHIEWPLPVAAMIGAMAAGIMAFVIGLAVLRLKTHYLAVASLGLIVVVQNLALNFDGFTRGGRGLTGIPASAHLPLIAFSTFLVIVICWQIKHSSIGRAMLAVRENEMAARCYGIDAFRLKLVAFVIGAMMAGFAGSLLAHVVTIMTPKSFGLVLAFNLIAMIVVGGQGSIIGAILAALVIDLSKEILRPLEESFQLYGLTQVLIAIALVLVLIWRPKGIFGLNEPLIKS